MVCQPLAAFGPGGMTTGPEPSLSPSSLALGPPKFNKRTFGPDPKVADKQCNPSMRQTDQHAAANVRRALHQRDQQPQTKTRGVGDKCLSPSPQDRRSGCLRAPADLAVGCTIRVGFTDWRFALIVSLARVFFVRWLDPTGANARLPMSPAPSFDWLLVWAKGLAQDSCRLILIPPPPQQHRCISVGESGTNLTTWEGKKIVPPPIY